MVSQKGAPDASEKLLLPARVPRAAPRATRNLEIYIRKIGTRKKGKEKGSNTPMGQRPGELTSLLTCVNREVSGGPVAVITLLLLYVTLL